MLFHYALDVDWVLFAQLCIRMHETSMMCLISFCIIQINETEKIERQSRIGMLYPSFLELISKISWISKRVLDIYLTLAMRRQECEKVLRISSFMMRKKWRNTCFITGCLINLLQHSSFLPLAC